MMKKQYISPSMKAHILNIKPLLIGSEQIELTDQSGPSRAKFINFVGGDDDDYDF